MSLRLADRGPPEPWEPMIGLERVEHCETEQEAPRV